MLSAKRANYNPLAMTTASALKEELRKNLSFTKEDLIEAISIRVRKSGRAYFICDWHIDKSKLGKYDNTIRLCDEYAAVTMAKEEGFSVSHTFNSYGVRYLVFSL